MAELIIRPDNVVSMGNWDPTAQSTVADYMSDNSDDTTVFNTNGNQSMQLSLADIPELYDEATFTSATATIRARRSGKGNASTTVKILNGTEAIVETTHTINSIAIAAYTSGIADISEMDLETINNLQFYMIGTGNTQAYYSEVFFTLTYEVEETPPVRGVKLSSGKLVLTGKVTF